MGSSHKELQNAIAQLHQTLLETQQLLIKGNEKSILTNKEFTAYLGISRDQAYQWRKKGLIKFHKKGPQKGRCIYYFKEDIIEFIKSKRFEGKE